MGSMALDRSGPWEGDGGNDEVEGEDGEPNKDGDEEALGSTDSGTRCSVSWHLATCSCASTRATRALAASNCSRACDSASDCMSSDYEGTRDRPEEGDDTGRSVCLKATRRRAQQQPKREVAAKVVARGWGEGGRA